MNGWVPLVDAAREARRAPGTLRVWVTRGKVRGIRGMDGVALVWLPDVMDATWNSLRRERKKSAQTP